MPSQYEVAYKGFTFDTTVMMDQMSNSMGPGMATEAAPQLAQVTQALSALGFERIAMLAAKAPSVHHMIWTPFEA